ncbi:hypothetical protein QTP70_007716 [Hemibagrus guttatus]|uniref:G-protein coupled receptors family 1 profile domain-containing protein n=1 Tax=Hemibagrus guttatus TaxID=175788 RepID=A0AAE0QQ07_9TELE|nr:hypothetical protein QTP70_007716 [Hemibagrus guttatus]
MSPSGTRQSQVHVTLRYWPFGPKGCQIHAFQGLVSILAGISFLGAVAWDRYHMYCTKQKIFWSTSLTMTSIMWILAVLWSALPLPFIGWGVFDFEPMDVGCTLDYTRGDRSVRRGVIIFFSPMSRAYITYTLALVLLYLTFPLLIMHSSYCSIYTYFKKIHNFKALPVLAKLSPISNALLYAYNNEFYRGGIWQFLTGQRHMDKKN